MCLIKEAPIVKEDAQKAIRLLKNSEVDFVDKLLSTAFIKEELAKQCEKPAQLFQPEGHPKQAEIDGEIWPPTFEAENVRSAKSMQLLGSDTFVCTYPKCGTTWIQHICSQLLFPRQYDGPAEGKELCFTSPMVERMGAQFCATLTHPRLLKTHFTWPNCPKMASSSPANSCKYIFAARNPKDCLVSYFHHHRNFRCYQWANGQFDVFFELFMVGRLGFGDYFDHLLSWLPRLGETNVLFLKYEDMLADLEGAVRRIAQFLGNGSSNVLASPAQLQSVVAASGIEAMRECGQHFFPANALENGRGFIRKGGTRDWKNWLSRAQSDRLDSLFRQRLAGTVAEHWWQREMQWDEPVEMKEEIGQAAVNFARPAGY